MGPIEQSIKEKLNKEYNPNLFDLENESHKHASKLGSESHFRVLMVSESFQGMKRIDRSRNVHRVLEDELKSIHALSLRLFSPEEWEKLDSKEHLLSPNCVSKK
jgi:BolA protein